MTPEQLERAAANRIQHMGYPDELSDAERWHCFREDAELVAATNDVLWEQVRELRAWGQQVHDALDGRPLPALPDAAEKERDDARNERGKLGSVVVALEKRNRELLCALAMYAVDEDGNATGGEPATSALNGERCCGEWPECSHGFAFWERISARAAAASGSGE